ncbi:MAG: type I pullulanase [Ruminococcus sp.]|nr:type I pullulanase [Ruminococcus sp.]
MKLRRTISLLLAVVMLATMALVTVSAADTSSYSTGAYNNQNKYEGGSYTYNGEDLGATYSPSSTTWKVWSPAATKIQLKLYSTGSDREMGAKVLGVHDFTTKGSSTNNYVWSITLNGDYKNVYYTYLITAQNIFGNVVTNETQDVYSKAVGVNGNRSMVVDLDSTDPEGWDSDTHVCHNNKTESAVWELHVRDFSCDPDSGVSDANRGNYLAFTEGGTTYKKQGSIATCLDYLTENNINTVQLMPIADFDGVDEVYGASEVDRNWGYNPKNFNVPDGSYSSNSYDGNVRINEVKQMVQALHDRGISVVMDVVYNHTAGSEGSSFTKTVPGYYYRMATNLANMDGSGQGNEMASDKAMMRNFIIQSLKYWANEYHIDGFRFDLMGCIDLTTLNQARSQLNAINNNILMYGEPWAGGTTANPSAPSEKNGASYAKGLGAFSGTFRTAASKVDSDKGLFQGWVGGTATSVSTVVSGIKAALMDNSDNTKTVNYLDCHDNLTLWDRLVGAYTKSGEGKSSVTVNTNVNSTDQKYIRQLKLGGVMLYTSQGITFMNSGIEFARTKQGQGNSYNSADQYNKLDWSRAGTYKSSVDYYRGLRQIKEVYTPFNDDSNTSKNTMSFMSQTGNLIAYTISNNTSNKANEWGKVAVLMNSGTSAQNVTLTGNWTVVANADNAGLKAISTASGNYSVPANSGAILVETSGYKDFSDKFTYGTLTTKHVLNGSVVKTETAKYRIGSTYHAHKDADLLVNNDVVSTDGNASGKFTGDTTVTYNYASNGKTKAKLTVKYVDQSGKALTPDMVYTLENGDKYSIPVCSIQRYQLDTDKYPADTTGTFTGAKTITFKYKPLATNTTTVHYYKPSTLTGSLLVYAYTDDGVEPLGPWATNPTMTSEGNGWYKYTIPIAACYVMFHGKTGGQEPGQNEPGYLVSGECRIKDRVISYSSTLVTSHIDIDTGAKLKPDVTVTADKQSTDQYKTTADTSLGELVETPANAEGFYKAGVTNVVYLYKKAGPTEPSIVDKYLLGDSNCDGKVNVNDVTYIQQGLVNLVILDSTSKRNGDVDGDGKIKILDANYIQRYMVGMDIPYKIGQEIIIYA